MPKFKVGDKVRVTHNDNGSDNFVGFTGTISSICNKVRHPYYIDFTNTCSFGDHELELVKPPIEIGQIYRTYAVGSYWKIENSFQYYGSEKEYICRNINTGELWTGTESRILELSKLTDTSQLCDDGTTYSTYNNLYGARYKSLKIGEGEWIELYNYTVYKNQIEEDLKKLS